MRLSILFAMALFVPVLSSAATIHVPADQPTIQAGIDAAFAGDTVLVQPGTYVEKIDFKGKAILVVSSDGAAPTIIDGSGSAGSVALFMNQEGPDSVLRGFTLTKGSGRDYEILPNTWYRCGAGVFIHDASPTLEENRITGNEITYSYSFGAGIFGDGASPLVRNNEISENVITSDGYCSGAGIHFENSSPSLVGNRIIANRIVTDKNTTSYGSGVYTGNSASFIRDNMILRNSIEGPGFGSGGGVRCYNSQPVIVNNVIAGNSVATGRAGAMEIFGCQPVVESNTVTLNIGPDYPNGAVYVFNTDLVIRNSIYWNPDQRYEFHLRYTSPSTASILDVAHTDLRGGQSRVFVESGCTLTWGPGMIDTVPGFAAPGMEDYHLTWTSPCKDAGDQFSPGLPDLDFEGDPRVADGAVDLGADEFHPHLYARGQAAQGGVVRLEVVGAPGSVPVLLWVGSGIMDPPLHLKPYGDFFLAPPIIFEADLGSITSPLGLLGFRVRVPVDFPVPAEIPFQALLGMKLTNPCLLAIE